MNRQIHGNGGYPLLGQMTRLARNAGDQRGRAAKRTESIRRPARVG